MAQCVGTSATMAEGGTFAGQQAQIAAVATRLFGTTVAPQAVIGETLRQVTPEPAPADPLFVEKLRSRVQAATPPSAVCAPRPQPGAAPAGVLSRVWPGVRYGRAPPEGASPLAYLRTLWYFFEKSTHCQIKIPIGTKLCLRIQRWRKHQEGVPKRRIANKSSRWRCRRTGAKTLKASR